MPKDFWIDRDGAAMIPPFMLPCTQPATEGERAALSLPGGSPALQRRGPGVPDARKARGR